MLQEDGGAPLSPAGALDSAPKSVALSFDPTQAQLAPSLSAFSNPQPSPYSSSSLSSAQPRKLGSGPSGDALAAPLPPPERKERRPRHNDDIELRRLSFFRSQLQKIYQIWVDRSQRGLFIFALALLALAAASMSYGSLSGCLVLIAGGIQLLFRGAGFVVLLNSAMLNRHKPNFIYSFGYDRFEILFAFSLGIFAMFVSLFIFFECFERAFAPEAPTLSPSVVSGFAVVHFVFHLVAVTFFRRSSLVRNAKETRYTREDANYVLTHLLSDGLCAAAILLSSWIRRVEVWTWVDCGGAALIMVLLIVSEAWPLCLENGRLLLQTTPASLREPLEKCLREASTVEGVLECSHEHFWTQSPGVFVGSLSVRVRSDANEQLVLAKVTNIFSHLITHLTIQIEKDDWKLSSSSS